MHLCAKKRLTTFDKIVDWFKFQAFADDKYKVAKQV